MKKQWVIISRMSCLLYTRSILNLSPDENYGSQKAPREFDLNIIPQQETEEENRVDGLSLATCKLFFPS